MPGPDAPGITCRVMTSLFSLLLPLLLRLFLMITYPSLPPPLLLLPNE